MTTRVDPARAGMIQALPVPTRYQDDVDPARAGMIPSLSGLSHVEGCRPRASGDDPASALLERAVDK